MTSSYVKMVNEKCLFWNELNTYRPTSLNDLFTWTGISVESIGAFARSILLTSSMTIACGSRFTLNYDQIGIIECLSLNLEGKKVIKRWFFKKQATIIIVENGTWCTFFARFLTLFLCLLIFALALLLKLFAFLSWNFVLAVGVLNCIFIFWN